MGQCRASSGQYRNPLAAQECARVGEVGVDMHHLHPKFFGPLPANGAFERRVGTT